MRWGPLLRQTGSHVVSRVGRMVRQTALHVPVGPRGYRKREAGAVQR